MGVHPEAQFDRAAKRIAPRPASVRPIGRRRAVEQNMARRQGIGFTALTFLERSLFVPKLRVSAPALVIVRHGQKIITWNGRRCVVAAEGGVAIAAGQTLDVINRPSPEGIYEEVWLSGDRAILRDWRDGGGAPVTEVSPIPRPAPEFRAAFDRAVEAITARNGVPYFVARRRIVEVMRWAGLARPTVLVPPAPAS